MVNTTKLPVNTGANATQMAQKYIGDGVTLVGASHIGDDKSSDPFSICDGVSPGVFGSTNRDTAFVTVNTAPCYVAGTLIRTQDGEVPVETLEPGDMILTRDHGPQPLRWTGKRCVAAIGDLAPIRIAAHSFGLHRALMVSPQHRVLIRGSLSEFLFGETEVLVAARHLLNDHTVTRVSGGMVIYVQLLFDQNELVFSEGLPCESILPGPQTRNGFRTGEAGRNSPDLSRSRSDDRWLSQSCRAPSAIAGQSDAADSGVIGI